VDAAPVAEENAAAATDECKAEPPAEEAAAPVDAVPVAEENAEAAAEECKAEPPAEEAAAPAAAEAAPAEPGPDEKMSPEQRANVENAFKSIDVNNNGSIDMTEFMTACTAMGMANTEDECKAMFDKFDLDHDKKISMDEFVKMVASFV